MTFRLFANCEFEARDLNDAFMKLAEHFEDSSISDLEFLGEIELEEKAPCQPNHKPNK